MVRDRPMGMWIFGSVFVASGLIVLTIPFTREFKLGDVRQLEIAATEDGDGDPMYQLRLWLSASRMLSLQAQPSRDRARIEYVAASLRRALNLSDIEHTESS